MRTSNPWLFWSAGPDHVQLKVVGPVVLSPSAGAINVGAIATGAGPILVAVAAGGAVERGAGDGAVVGVAVGDQVGAAVGDGAGRLAVGVTIGVAVGVIVGTTVLVTVG